MNRPRAQGQRLRTCSGGQAAAKILGHGGEHHADPLPRAAQQPDDVFVADHLRHARDERGILREGDRPPPKRLEIRMPPSRRCSESSTMSWTTTTLAAENRRWTATCGRSQTSQPANRSTGVGSWTDARRITACSSFLPAVAPAARRHRGSRQSSRVGQHVAQSTVLTDEPFAAPAAATTTPAEYPRCRPPLTGRHRLLDERRHRRGAPPTPPARPPAAGPTPGPGCG